MARLSSRYMFLCGVLGCAVGMATLISITSVSAQSLQAVVPIATIYPGDVLTRGVVRYAPLRGGSRLDRDMARHLDQVVGKVARRTLMPGEAIRLHMVASAVRVRSGSNVRVVFEDAGVSVVSLGIALQAGSIGDQIRVRNSDSGVVVLGTVHGAGYVRVSGR